MQHLTLRVSLHSLAAVLAMVAVAAGPSAADDPETAARWSFLGPEGGHVRTLAVGFRDAPILHVGLATGGIYNGTAGRLRADREGLPDAVIVSLAIDPTEPSIVYAALERWGSPVFKSYNGGGTWERRGGGLSELGFINVLAIDPLHPRIVFAGTSEGIYRSADGGRSWHPRSHGLPRSPLGQRLPDIQSLVVDPRQPRIVYAAGSEGVYRSDNGGTTWKWDRRSLLLGSYDAMLAVDPASPRTLYLGSQRGLFRSTDGGRRWRDVGEGLAGGVRALAVSSALPGVAPCGEVWTVVSAGLFVSRDCARSWAPAGRRGRRGEVTALATDPGDPARLWAGTTLGVFESRDHGATWRPVHRGMRAIDISSLVFGPGRSPELFAGSRWHGVFRRPPDGGWKRIVVPGDKALIGPVTASPSDPATLYAATLPGPGVARSVDGGGTWNGSFLAEECVAVESIDVDPETPTTVFARVYPVGHACFKGCTAYRSSDGGETWGCLPVGAPGGLAIDPLHPTTLWVGRLGIPEEGPSVYRSLDGGDSWHWVASVGPDASVEVLEAGPNVLLAGLTDGRVLRSTDGGESWDDLSDGLPTARVTALKLDPRDPDHVVAAFAGRGVYRSTDGGATWEPRRRGLPAGLIVDDLLFDPAAPVLYAASAQGTYRLEL